MSRSKYERTARPSAGSPGHVPEERFVAGQRVGEIDVRGLHRRVAREGLSKRGYDEKTELRALIQDAVLEATTAIRRRQIANGVEADDAVQIVEEFDPVVEMAVICATTNDDKTRLAAAAEVATYLRPKLKQVEVITDTSRAADIQRRNEIAREMFGRIDDLARQRRLAHDKKIAEEGVVLDEAPKD